MEHALGWGALIFFVADLFHPIDDFSIQRFGNCNVRHGSAACRSMPMLLSGSKPNYISRKDFFYRSAFTLRSTPA